MVGSPPHSRRAMLINTIAISLLAFILAIGAVWLYEVLAPIFGWPVPFQ